VKEFAEMHGGRVELTSQVGEGATFKITLPGCCVLTEEIPVSPAGDGVGTEPERDTGSVISDGLPDGQPANPPTQDEAAEHTEALQEGKPQTTP
jgi:hypothetical protein